MVDHRKTLSRRAYVLPGWFLGITMVTCVLGLIGLGWAVFFTGDESEPASAPTTATASPTPTPTPSPTPSESPSPEPEPEVTRADIDVAVLNASRTVGLARRVANRAENAGWTVTAVGNWRTGAAQNAVHFPSGRKAEARLLAKDLGIDAVRPSTTGMRSDRLTVILLRLP